MQPCTDRSSAGATIHLNLEVKKVSITDSTLLHIFSAHLGEHAEQVDFIYVLRFGSPTVLI